MLAPLAKSSQLVRTMLERLAMSIGPVQTMLVLQKTQMEMRQSRRARCFRRLVQRKKLALQKSLESQSSLRLEHCLSLGMGWQCQCPWPRKTSNLGLDMEERNLLGWPG